MTRGFTIIELVIAAAIALVIMGIGMMIITGAGDAYTKTKTRIRRNDMSRQWFELLERDMGSALSQSIGIYGYAPGDPPPIYVEFRANMDSADLDEGVGWVRYYVLNGKAFRVAQSIPFAQLPSYVADAALFDASSFDAKYVIFEQRSGRWGYFDEARGRASHVLFTIRLTDEHVSTVGVPFSP
jgi:hypothetical protein